MKCPKCEYLGFETGDRCRNCGYNFSLFIAMEADRVTEPATFMEMTLDTGRHEVADTAAGMSLRDTRPVEASDVSLRGGATGSVVEAPASPAARDTRFPLFPAPAEDDTPLVRVPAVPRAPLAVRRTPESPRLRHTPRTIVPPAPPAPVLQFADDVAPPPPEPSPAPVAAPAMAPAEAGPWSAGLLASAVDAAILTGIAVSVVYLTSRMAGLSLDEWRLLPVVPMATFLALLTGAYFFAFTAVGGQTIGKMAAGTRVVTDEGRAVTGGRALQRTGAALLSCVSLGLGFLPVLFGDRRALHDRLARTRVVRVRSV